MSVVRAWVELENVPTSDEWARATLEMSSAEFAKRLKDPPIFQPLQLIKVTAVAAATTPATCTSRIRSRSMVIARPMVKAGYSAVITATMPIWPARSAARNATMEVPSSMPAAEIARHGRGAEAC